MISCPVIESNGINGGFLFEETMGRDSRTRKIAINLVVAVSFLR